MTLIQDQQLTQAIRDLLYDENEDVSAREGAAYTIYETLRSAMEYTGMQFEFVEELAAGGDDLDPFIVDDNEDVDQQELHQELHQVLGHPQPAGAPGNEVQEADIWMQALTDHGLVQGDGSVDAPVYTGARDLKAEPKVVEITMDVNDQLNIERLQEIQASLFRHFSDQVIHGSVNRRRVYMKLHPWAVINWVNYFTGMITGAKGLNKIQAVVSASGKANEHGDTYQDIQRAKMLSQSGELSREERMLFDTIANVMDTDMPKSNAYTKFINTCSCAVLYQKFLGLVREAQHNPTGEVSRSLQRQRAVGRSVRDRVAHACAANMKWTVPRFNELLERHAALSSCGLAFSGGFLLLVDDKMRAM